jgi:hypothetical protein
VRDEHLRQQGQGPGFSGAATSSLPLTRSAFLFAPGTNHVPQRLSATD